MYQMMPRRSEARAPANRSAIPSSGTLLPANHAMVAVPVSAGVHRVELSYTVPGQRTGTVVTGGAFLVCLGIVALWWWRRRSGRGAAPGELPDRW